MTNEPLSFGVYDSVIDAGLSAALGRTPGTPESRLIEALDQPDTLSRFLSERIREAMTQAEPGAARRALVNRLLATLGLDPLPEAEFSRLIALRSPHPVGSGVRYGSAPVSPLSLPALMTNAEGEPRLGHELRTELMTCDSVDLLCAFIKWQGMRVLEEELKHLAAHGIPLRVITTTYLGATERPALDRLVNTFGAQVKVNYETNQTRLHAKAWLFRRKTGFDSAYVGSSNLSRQALLDGLEWNVRLGTSGTGSLLTKFSATFESYWNDPAFITYHPDSGAERLDEALQRARGSTLTAPPLSISGLEVRPYPHQQQMLDALAAERGIHGRHRNLIIAATGTGKTVVAALDYRSMCPGGRRPSLLFVAHREEILDQALRTYREVLQDASFGEKLVGGHMPTDGRHVFASVQSLSSRNGRQLPLDTFEVVVVDEFHHARASTYRSLMARTRPRELLGMTATPERADGLDIIGMFDGRIAFELRLWDALRADLLCPFHYFGIADDVDLSQVGWRRGGYNSDELSQVFTGNAARVRLVLRAVRDKVADPLTMRALGFCVSIAHAEFMADQFRAAGIPAVALCGQTTAKERKSVIADLRLGKIAAIFVVDLFNEGVDIPEVDTVLFLRPTESLTVFLQQLGRGLRRTRTKAVLTVLDFVGHHREEYRLDQRFAGMTGLSRRELEQAVEEGFPFLPSGCQILLDRRTQEEVLQSVRRQVTSRWRELISEVRALQSPTLAGYLRDSQRELADVVRGHSWTELRRQAGLPTPGTHPGEGALLRRGAALAHVDDPERASVYLSLLSPEGPQYDELSPAEQHFARMLFFTLWPSRGRFASYQQGFDTLRATPAACDEFTQVIELGLEKSRHIPRQLEGRLARSPLRSHASYSREEILAALDYASEERKPVGFAAGVVYSPEWATDAFLITLRKDPGNYSPTTMYQDYAMGPRLFHWQSQNRTSLSSEVGRRYINHRERGSSILLFAREHRTTSLGTSPYFLLGTAEYVSHHGERPITFTWRTNREMPADFLTRASVTA